MSEMQKVGEVRIDGRTFDLCALAAPKTRYTYPVGTVVTFNAVPYQSQVRQRDGSWRDLRDNQQWGNNTDDTIWEAVKAGRSTVVFEPQTLGEPPIVRSLPATETKD